MKTMLFPKRSERVLTNGDTVHASLHYGIACCFTLHCVNWLLPPAGSNVNTLRKSRLASFLERLSVPGLLACIP